jgi:hypothetical protein
LRSVSRIGESFAIEIRFMSYNSSVTAAVANAVADVYISECWAVALACTISACLITTTNDATRIIVQGSDRGFALREFSAVNMDGNYQLYLRKNR